MAPLPTNHVVPIEDGLTYLQKSEYIGTVKKEIFSLFTIQYPEVGPILSQQELQDIDVYKLYYKTKNLEAIEVIASGVVIVPVSGENLPLFSYQHGTISNRDDTPSKYNTGMETIGLASIIASTGYAVSVPDYLGYGETDDYPHPYEHVESLGSASFDMLMAAKEFLDVHGYSISDKLFLTGYSEGGNATMALHRHIEKNTDLVVTMSAPAAGAYNKTAFAKEILSKNEDLRFLPNFMWVIDSFDDIYGLNRQWSDYVLEPDATTLTNIVDPLTYGNADIKLNPQQLFTTEFKNGILNETDTEFINALSASDNYDWTPRYPITLYYGTADDYVFPINSIIS